MDTGQTEFDALAETGGAKTHTLTSTEMPTHRHRIAEDTTGGYSVTTWNATTKGATGFQGGTGSDRPVPTSTYVNSTLLEETGGGAAHNNLQPYIVLRYIIKT